MGVEEKLEGGWWEAKGDIRTDVDETVGLWKGEIPGNYWKLKWYSGTPWDSGKGEIPGNYW